MSRCGSISINVIWLSSWGGRSSTWISKLYMSPMMSSASSVVRCIHSLSCSKISRVACHTFDLSCLRELFYRNALTPPTFLANFVIAMIWLPDQDTYSQSRCIYTARRLMFPPEKWNMHHAILNNQTKTNNICERWNNISFFWLGGARQPLWVEAHRMSASWRCHRRWNFAAGRTRHSLCQENEKGLQEITDTHPQTALHQHDGKETILEFLRGVSHNFRGGKMNVNMKLTVLNCFFKFQEYTVKKCSAF